MSDAEWSSAWKPIKVGADAGGFDFLEELYRNFRKRARIAARVCDNWPRGHKEWDITCLDHSTVRYGTIGSVTSVAGTIIITDATSPSLAMLVDSDAVKRWVDWEPGFFDGVHLDGTNNEPGSYYIVLDVDDPHARNVYRALIDDTTQSSGAGSFLVKDDGTLSLNRTLASFAGKHYSILTTTGQVYGTGGYLTLSWADRWPRYPVWTNDSGVVATILTGTGTSGSSTTTVEDSAHDADPLWPTLDATMSVKLQTASGPDTFDYRAITANSIPPATTHARANVSPAFSVSPNTKTYSVISSTTKTLTDATKAWTVNMHAGADLIGYVAGRIVRIPIISNTAITLTFAAQTVPPEGNYWITKSGKWWGFDENGDPNVWKPYQWYGGLMDVSNTHFADDQLHGFATTATISVKVNHGGPFDPVCALDSFHVLDDDPADSPDVYFETDDHCGSNDLYLSPFMYRSLRGMQYAIEATAPAFVLDFKLSDDDGNHAASMALGYPPMLMKKIGGTYWSRTIVGQAGGFATFSGSISPPDGEANRTDAKWIVTDANDQAIPNRFGIGSLTFADNTIGGEWTDDDVTLGNKVVITLGWDRAEPRRVQQLYPRIVFGPDPIYNEDTGDVIGYSHSVTQNQPGEYVLYPASTNCAVYSLRGELTDGRTLNGDLTDQRFRYVGHNRGDPTSGAGDPDDVEWDHEILFPDARCVTMSAPVDGVQKMWMQGDDTSGIVTSATASSITTLGAHLECSHNPRIIHTSTATADGSTTTLTDTTFSTAVGTEFDFTGYSIWQSTGAYGSRFVGMFLQRETAVGSGVFEKRLIVDQSDSAGGTLTVSPGFTGSTATGMAWKIAEPAGLGDGTGPGVQDFYAEHTLRITKQSDGSTVDLVINHNDQDTFAFDAGSYTPVAGDKWDLVYYRPGDVVEWDGTEFVAVDMTPYKPVTDFAALEPTVITQYGRWTKGDRPLHNNGRMLQQMKDAVDAMHLAVEDSAWNNNGEDNQKTQTVFYPFEPGGWEATKSTAASAFTALSASSSGAGDVPTIGAILDGATEPAEDYSGQLLNRWNYLTASPFQCARFGMTSRRVQIYLYPVITTGTGGLVLVDGDPYGPISAPQTIVPTDDNPASYSVVMELQNGLKVSGSGGTGADLNPGVWTKVYDVDTSDPTISIQVGDPSLALPSWPSSDPDYPSDSGDNKVIQTIKWATVYGWFALVDWQSAFDAAT